MNQEEIVMIGFRAFDGKVVQVEWVRERNDDFSYTLYPTVTVRRY